MQRIIFVLIIAMLALTACSLSEADDSTAQPTEIALNTREPIANNPITDPVIPEPQDVPISDDGGSQAEPADDPQGETGSGGGNDTVSDPVIVCQPRTDWTTVHIVSPGETLGSIARAAGTTVSTLADANCIDNVNVITVGQQIRVPRQLIPPTITPVPQPTPTFRPPLHIDPPEKVGGLDVTQIIGGDAGFVTLLRDAPATVTWMEAPAVARMTVYAFEPGWTWDWSGPNTVEVGTDNDPSNGLSVAWAGGVTPNLQHELIAFGYDAAGSLIYTSHSLSVSSAASAVDGCRIRPPEGVTINYYTSPEVSDSPAGSFTYPQAIPVMGRLLNGWYAISDHVAFSGVGGVQSLKWVPVNAAVEIVPGGANTVNTCG